MKCDMGKVLIAVFVFCVSFCLVGKADGQTMTCKRGGHHLTCEASGLGGNPVIWRQFLVIGNLAYQTDENRDTYNLTHRFFVPKADTVIEMEVLGEKLYLCARYHSQVVMWRCDEGG